MGRSAIYIIVGPLLCGGGNSQTPAPAVRASSLPSSGANRQYLVQKRRWIGESLAFGTYSELAARSRLVDALAMVKPWQPTLAGPSEPERLNGSRVTSAYFHVLGVAPALGNDFEAADDRRGG